MSVTCGLPDCVRQPAAAFVNYVHTVTHSFRQLGLSLIVIFTCATHEPTHSNDCGPSPKKVGHSVLNLSEYYIDMGEVSVKTHIMVYAFRRQTL